MKTKIIVELKKEEMIRYFDFLTHVFDRIMDRQDIERDPRNVRADKLDPGFSMKKENEEESSEEGSSEEESSEEGEYVEELDESIENKKRFLIAQGLKVFENLMDAWLVNYKLENTEQPDRALLLRDLSISKNGFRILAYLQSVNSLTLAILDYLEKFELDDPIDPDRSKEEYAREMAEHLSQVSSIVFYQISDFLRYPNPLEK